jgi:uncharacterized phage protein (TIGR02220 family)
LSWIEIHNSFFTNPKLKLLAAILGIEKMLASAYLIRFWSWAIDNILDEAGEITHLDAEDLAAAAGWRKSSEKFFNALIASRWLDKHDERIFIHDWSEYAGRLIRKRLIDRERKRKEREKCFPSEVAGISDGNSDGIQSEIPADGAAHTIPYHTVPNISNDILSPIVPDGDVDVRPVKEIVGYLNEKAGTAYKHSSRKTRDLIQARFNDGFTLDDFKTVIDKKCVEWVGTEREKFLRPETLFSNKFEGYLNQKTGKSKSEDWRSFDAEQ